MPPMGALDLLIGGNSASMYPGASLTLPNMLNMGNVIPGMNGAGGMMTQMFMQPLLQNMLGPRYAPGQFSPQGNLYDFYQQQQQFQSMQRAIKSAGEVDQGTYMKYAQGMSALMGHRFTDDRARSARIMAQDISAVTPMLAQMMPEVLDRLHGSRGSAQVMAQSLFAGGRYMIDPITGRQGMSSDSVTAITDRARGMFWGPGSDPNQFNGMSAGRVGMMVDELARRGQLYPAMRREQMVKEIATNEVTRKNPGLKGPAFDREIADTMDKLEKVGGDQIRNFQADKVLGRVKELSKVVGAMQDIFGALGRPDAPMSELLSGLQTLTQGGLQNLSGRQAEDMVRSFSNMARRTGVGLDNATALVAAGGQRAEQFGINRIFGANAAIGGMAFGQAFGAAEGGLVGFNRPSKEQITALTTRLMTGAAASGDANQLGAVMRLVDTGLVKPKGELAAMVNALKEGQNEYTFNGVTKGTYMRPGEFTSFMAKQGVDPRLLGMAISQTTANQASINEHGLMDISFKNQGVQFRDLTRDAYRNLAVQAKITDRKLLDEVSRSATDFVLNEDAVKGEDPNALAAMLKKKFKGRVSDGQLDVIAQMGNAAVDSTIQRSDKLRGLFGSGSAARGVYRKPNQEAYDAIRADNRVEGMFQSALAGLGRDNVTQRIADSILEAGPKTSFKDIVAKVIGFEPSEEVSKAMNAPMQALKDAMTKYKEVDKIKNPQERMKAANARLKEVQSAVAGLQASTKKHNLDSGAVVSLKDIGGVLGQLDAGSGKGLLEMEELTQSMLHDDRTMEVLGPGGLKLGRSLLNQKMAIEKAASAAGMTVDDFMKTDVGGKMLHNFQKSVGEVRTRLANPSNKPIGIEERKEIAKYNSLRTESPTATMERIRKDAGLAPGTFSKSMAGLEAGGAFAGLAGASLREASASLSAMKIKVASDLKIDPKDLTPEMFAEALKKGGNLTDEDRAHLMNATAGTGVVGRGLTALLHKDVTGDMISSATNDYRRASDPGAVAARRFARGLGIDPNKSEKMSGIGFGMNGQSLNNVMQSADALQMLRVKWGGEKLSNEDFAKRLAKGDTKDEEEKSLYALATRGKGKELSEAVGTGDATKLANVMKMIGDQRETQKVEVTGGKLTGTMRIIGMDNPQASAEIEADLTTGIA